MSRMANLSIMGLYEWDNTIFDLFQLPEGINLETLKLNILSQLAELELLYPNPVLMKNLIGVWSKTCEYEWNKLADTMKLEYNPIDNYDRTEIRTLKSTGEGHSQDSGTDSTTAGGTVTNKVNAYNGNNSETMADKEQNVDSHTGSMTYGKKNDETFDKNDEETIHARGNIGVRSSQELLEQERNIAKFNIYDIITDEFKMRFCILVY